MSGYTTQDVARMIGVSAGRLRAYLRAGVLSPEKRRPAASCASRFRICCCCAPPRGWSGSASRRSACGARSSKLRARLPEDAAPDRRPARHRGPEVVVHEGGARWQVESGQVLLAFGTRTRGRRPVAAAPCSARPTPPTPQTRRLRRGRRCRSRRSTRSAATSTRPIPPTPRPATGRCIQRRRSTRTPTSTSAASSTSAATSRRAETHYRAALETRPDDATAHLQPGRRARGPGSRRRGAGRLRAGHRRRRAQRRRALQRRPPLRSGGRLQRRAAPPAHLPRARPPGTLT